MKISISLERLFQLKSLYHENELNRMEEVYKVMTVAEDRELEKFSQTLPNHLTFGAVLMAAIGEKQKE